jgi:hypothetical protein
MSVCARCGRDDDELGAMIGDEEFCHSIAEVPTCYMLECWERNTGTNEDAFLSEIIEATKQAIEDLR